MQQFDRSPEPDVVVPEPTGLRFNDNLYQYLIATGQTIHVASAVWLADVDVGQDETRQIMWGGVNLLRPGHLVPVALPGARRANGKKLRPSTYTFGDGDDAVRVT